jgi:putative dimethyl sulfoxide reductase chaperone
MLDSTELIVARSKLWGLLAFGFGYPDTSQFALITNGTLYRDALECIEACLPAEDIDVELLTAGLQSMDDEFTDFEAEYLSSFHTNTPKPSASLFESHYLRGRDKASILLELKTFFDIFGLSVAKGGGDLEDSLTGELEFMHFLSAREAQAQIDSKNDKPYDLAQRDFLKRHLALWIPVFRKDVEEKSRSGFYHALARITDVFVAHEVDRFSGILDQSRNEYDHSLRG